MHKCTTNAKGNDTQCQKYDASLLHVFHTNIAGILEEFEVLSLAVVAITAWVTHHAVMTDLPAI